MIQELYPYQQIGSAFLAGNKRAILADTMGLGKTAQAIVAAEKLRARCVVVICPAGVRINWKREYQRFSHRELIYRIIDSGRSSFTDDGVNIISYELATTANMKKRLMAMTIDVLILDESHFLKSRDAKRTQAIYGAFCNGTTGIMSRATHIWALTGTPTPNHPGEIYSTLKAFGVWAASYWDFEAKFCIVEEGLYGNKIVGMKNVDQLKSLVKPIMLRRKVEEVMTDLPKVTISDLVLSAHGISHPEDIQEWEKAENGREAEKLKSRLEQTADENNLNLADLHLPTLRRLTGIAKVRPVCELIMRELDSGLDKIVIFGEHRDVLEQTRQILQKYGAQIVYGGNTPEVKQQRIDRFVNIWKYRVLIGHITTLGTGIDGLQKVCCNGLFIESSWTPSNNLQAIGRLRRTGQSRPVMIRFASLADSLDEHVQRIITKKTKMISELLD